MKKKTLTKRIVSFITALSLSISSTVMVLPASAYIGDKEPEQATIGGECKQFNCMGHYSWEEDSGNHVLKCDTCDNDSGITHPEGTNDSCTVCAAMPTIEWDNSSIEHGSIKVKLGNTEIQSGTKVRNGSNVTVEGNPEPGYKLSKISYGGSDLLIYDDENDVTIDSINASGNIEAEFTAIDYTVNVTFPNAEDGTISVDNTTANVGDTVTITVAPASGRRFVDLPTVSYGDNQTVQVNKVEDGEYTFTMPPSDVTISGQFEELTYNTTGDSISGVSSIKVNDVSQDVLLSDVSNNDVITIIPSEPESGKVIDTVKVEAKSAILSSGEYEVQPNENGEYKFRPIDLGYKEFFPYSGISVRLNITVTTTQGYQLNLTNPTVTGSTAPALTIKATVNGKEVASGTYLKPGTEVTLSCVAANDDYNFSDWSVTGATVENNTFEMPENTVNVTATCTEKPYRVDIPSPENGSVTVTYGTGEDTTTITDGALLTAGKFVTIKAVPDDSQNGKTFVVDEVKVTKNGVIGDNKVDVLKTADDTYTFTMPKNGVTIEVTFKQVYNIDIDNVANASVTATYGDDNTAVTSSTKLAEGTAVKVKVDNISEGYAVKAVKYGTTDITESLSDGYYTFTMPAENVTITVTLVKTYNVNKTIVGSEYGTVVPCEGYSFENVKVGDVVRFTVLPNDGYGVYNVNVSIPGWHEQKDDNGNILYYYFTMPDNDVTIYVTFDKLYTLTKSDTENGSFTLKDDDGNPVEEAFDGDTILIDLQPDTTNPDEKYIVKSVKYSYGGNDYTVTKNDDGKYEFRMPEADVTVSVDFEEVYQVVTTTDSHGEIKPCEGIDFRNVFYGDEVRFTVEPKEGYVVDSVSIEALSSISGSAAISSHYDSNGKIDYYYFRMPDGNVRVCVTFEKLYSVTTTVIGNGTVSLEDDDENAIESGAMLLKEDEVVVKVQPDNGYKLESVSYFYEATGNGKVDVSSAINEITPVRGIYSFKMPAADVEVTATFVELEPVFTVAVGEDKETAVTTNADKWSEVISFINEKGGPSEFVTITLNEDYTFTSKDKLPAANKVGYLTLTGDGTLTFDKSVTALKLVSDTDLDLKTASEKKINVTVAAGKSIWFDSNFSGDILGKVTGTKTSVFIAIANVTVDQLSTFKSVGFIGGLTVNGNVSAIEELEYISSGSLTVSGAKSVVDINKVTLGVIPETAIINLVQGADGKMPKLTVGEASKLTINVVNSDGNVVDLEPGTIVAYSKGNDISKNITIGNKMGDNALTAFYYPKTKAVKAEYYVLSVAEKDGEKVNYPNIEAAFEAMTGYKDYTLTLNDDITVPSKLALPKGIKSLTINTAVVGTKLEKGTDGKVIEVDVYGDYTITFTAAKLAIPYDVTFDVNFAVSNSKDLIDITVAKDSALIFNKAVGEVDWNTGELVPCINKITGTKTSTLGAYYINDTTESVAVFNNIATFGKLDGNFHVKGTVTGVTELEGVILLWGEKASATVENVALGSQINLIKNSKGEIPKFTITDIITGSDAKATAVSVFVLDMSPNEMYDYNRIGRLTTGTTVLYTKGKDLSDKITIANVTEEGKNLSAVYYEKTKSIKAEFESAVTVYKGDTELVGSFKNLDEAFTELNSLTGADYYTIVLSTAVTADAKFAFPKSTKTNPIGGIIIMSAPEYEMMTNPQSLYGENEVVMSAPDSGNEILMFDSGVSITFTGTKLAIPYDVTFNVPVKASNKNDLIDITVAKDAALVLNGGSGDFDLATLSTKTYINKISGTKTSTLEIEEATVAKSVSNFESVISTGTLTVEGTVTGIGIFKGKLTLYGDKASASIENIVDAEINVLKNSNGAVPKITVTDISTSLEISVFDSVLSSLEDLPYLESGTVVAYTKGKDLSNKITITNTDSSGTKLTPVFDKGKKTVTAVNSQALTLNVMKLGDKGAYVVDTSVKPVNASSFDELVKLINSNKYAKGDKLPYYQIVVNTSLELPANFALPKATQASGMIITAAPTSGSTPLPMLTFTGTKLAVPYDLTLDIGIKADNKSGKLDINVAKDCDLTIDDFYAENGEMFFGKVTGSGDSTLSNIEVGIYGTNFTGISGFNKVMGIFEVNGAVSKIGEFSGELYIGGEKASADINKINALSGKTSSTVVLCLNSKGELPKLTIGSIADDVKLDYKLYSYYYNTMNVASGKTILYTKTADFADKDQIVIYNGSREVDASLSASFDSKTKSVKAVAAAPVLLSVIDNANKETVPVSNGSDGKFATLEEAVAYIDKNGSSTTGYHISLTSHIECSKLNLPKAGKASELVIDGSSYTINVGKTASITSNTDLTLVNAYFETNAKSFTINAKGNVELLRSNYGIDEIKGGAKNTLTLSGYNACDVTGFGTVNVEENCSLFTNTTLKTNNLVLGKYACVGFCSNLKSATFSSLKAAKGAGFTYQGILKNAPKFTGKAENFNVNKDGFYIDAGPSHDGIGIGSGSKILSTKALTDLSIFKYWSLGDECYTFKQVGNDICLTSAESFGLSSDKNSNTQYFSNWEDAVNAINSANDSSATYTIELYNNVEVSKLTFPAKGKYKELVISSNKKLKAGGSPVCMYISGAVTLTGNTTFEDVYIIEPSSKAGEAYASYNVNASGYDIVLDNANLFYANIKAKNVTLLNTVSSTGIDMFIVNKLDVTDTLTAAGDDSVFLISAGGITAKNMTLEVFMQIRMLEGKKINVTDTLSCYSVEKDYTNFLVIGVLNESGFGDKFAKNYSLGKIRNGANNVFLYSEDYIISPDSNGNLYVVRG